VVAVAYPYTIRQLLLDFGLYLKDSHYLVATATGTSGVRFACSVLDAQALGVLADSELFPWDVPAGATTNDTKLPLTVLDNQLTGAGTHMEITYDHAPYSLPFTTGNRAVLSNLAGRGYPQGQREWALKMASMEVGDTQGQPYRELATPSTTDYWNAIPSDLRSLYRVTAYSAAANYESEISPAVWQTGLDRAGRRINLPFNWQGADTARLYGTIDQTIWWDSLRSTGAAGDLGANMATYSQQLYGDPRRLIMAAVPWLLDGRGDARTARQAQFEYQRRLREAGQARPRANEVWLE